MAEKIEVGVTIKGTQSASNELNALDDGIKKLGSGMDGLVTATDKFTGGAATGMVSAYRGTLTFIKGLKLTKIALISTGIGAIVVVIGALVAAFMSSESQAQSMKVSMAGLGGAVEKVTTFVSALGGWITGLFSGGVTGAMENYRKELDKMPGSMQDAIDAARDLEVGLQKLNAQQRAMNAVGASSNLIAYKARLAAEDTSKSLEERIGLTKEANRVDQKFLEIQTQLVRDEKKLAEDAIAAGQGSVKENEDIILASMASLAKMEIERMNLIESGNSSIRKLRQEDAEALAAEAATAQELRDAAKEASDEAKDLADEAKVIAAEQAEAERVARIALEDELWELSQTERDRKELALQQEYERRVAIAGDDEELLKSAEQRLIDDLAAIQQKADDDAAAVQKIADDKSAAAQDVINADKLAKEEAVAQAMKTARLSVISASFDALNALAKTEEQSKKIAIAQILVNQAIAMSQAIAGATTSATATGPGAFVATPLFIAQALAIVIGSFASIKGVMNSAGAATQGLDLSPPSVGGGGGGGGVGGGESSGTGNQLALTPDGAYSFSGNSEIPPVQAYIVQNDIADAGALQTELQNQASL